MPFTIETTRGDGRRQSHGKQFPADSSPCAALESMGHKESDDGPQRRSRQGEGTHLGQAQRRREHDASAPTVGTTTTRHPVTRRACAAAGIRCERLNRPLDVSARSQAVYMPLTCTDAVHHSPAVEPGPQRPSTSVQPRLRLPGQAPQGHRRPSHVP